MHFYDTYIMNLQLQQWKNLSIALAPALAHQQWITGSAQLAHLGGGVDLAIARPVRRGQ